MDATDVRVGLIVYKSSAAPTAYTITHADPDGYFSIKRGGYSPTTKRDAKLWTAATLWVSS